MRKTLLVLLSLLCVHRVMAADPSPWLTSLPDALNVAKKENKLILMDFTGSDWCPACIVLHDEVLTKPEFVSYAKTNLVLVLVDFPIKKTLPADVQKANDDLQTQYHVIGYPTLIALGPDGRNVWSHTGLVAGGVTGLITNLESARIKH